MSGQRTFGAHLRELRVATNLTQEELAERSGLSAQAIGALERGDRKTPRPSTVESLAEALELDAAQRRTFIAAARRRPVSESADPLIASGPPPSDDRDIGEAGVCLAFMPADVLPDRAPLPAGSRMPLAPNPLFVGRGDELLQVAAVLRGGETTVALGQVVASTGLGGLGKTQLAVELVHRYGRYFAGGVFWLSFASADEIPLQVAACAGPDALDLAPGIESLPLEERLKRVQRAWQSAVPRLLVFDNCEEEALLEEWRPPSGGCRVLVTSRRSHWSPTLGVTALPLDLLPRVDSVALLRRYRPDVAVDDPVLECIATELGDLPLALHLAGSYLRAYRAEVSLAGYLAELRHESVVHHASLLGAGLDDSVSPTHHVQGVAQTFAVCLSRLDREREVDRVAIALLARLACMAPGEPVPRDLLAKASEDVDPLRRADGLRRLGAVGLVDEGGGSLRLHRLLAHFVREERLDPTARSVVDRALIECGEAADRGQLTGPALATVIPHLIDVASTEMGDQPHLARLCRATGLALQHAGDLGAATPWLERALQIREAAVGREHPDTATSLNNLAVLLWGRGELAAARPLHERALAINERVLGPDHVSTAFSLNELAILLRAQGEPAAAQRLHERALAIRELALGPSDPLTAESLNNLANALKDQRELAAATPLFERALAINERVLGPDHINTARSLNNLGCMLQDQGILSAARPLQERALRICERVLGPDHPFTSNALDSLARLLQTQGELAAARPLFERVLTIRERMLGPDHPQTAASLHNLGNLLVDQGDPAAARLLFERALATRERVLGPGHPDTVATRRALEELAGDVDDATADG